MLFVVLTLGIIELLVTYYSNYSLLLDLSQEVFEQSVTKVQKTNDVILKSEKSHMQVASLFFSRYDIEHDREKLWMYSSFFLKGDAKIYSLFYANIKGDFIQVIKGQRGETITRYKMHDGVENDIWQYRDSSFNVIKTEVHLEDYSPVVRPWFKKAIETKQFGITSLYKFNSSKKMGISLINPVFKRDSIVGVIGLHIDLSKISNMLARLKFSKHSRFMAGGTGGKILLTDKQQFKDSLVTYDMLEDELLKEAFECSAKNKNSKNELQYNGETYFVDRVALLENNEQFFLLIITPKSVLFKPVVKNMIISALIIFIVLIIAVIYSIILARRISFPINELSRQMEDLKNLKLDGIDTIPSKIYEVQSISNSMQLAVSALKSFKKYVPSDLVSTLIKDGQVADIGGETRRITVMFTDIKDFTTISENLSSAHLTIHLSEYLEIMTDIIMFHGGTVDKFLGDGILAFWGAPKTSNNTATQACLAAVECQKELERVNKFWAASGDPEMITRIGINTGEVTVGNIGTSKRLEYTVIGDVVNVASRIEGVNKEFGTNVLISEETYNEVKNEFDCEYVSDSKVKGRKGSVKLYELKNLKSQE